MNEPTYCKSCGAYIPEGKNKCLACGSITPFAVDCKEKELQESNNVFDKLTKESNVTILKNRQCSSDLTFSVNGIVINERGQVLSVPSDFYDKVKLEVEEDLKQNKPLCFAANDRYKHNKKADIDLDKLLNQELFTVKIGGKVKWFYFGKADMEIGGTIYHTKDLFGRIVINEKGKNKFHLTLIER